MKVNYEPDFPVTDESCREKTGKSMSEWFALIEEKGFASKRREAISMLYDEMGRGKDVWWPTTIWVEYEKSKGIVKKDGRAEGYNICVTKTIKAPVEDVYRAWASEGELKQWVCGGYEGDVVEGGAFSDCDGNTGTYTRVRENKDIRMAWKSREGQAETQVDVAFADKGGGKTGLTLTHQRIQDRPEADGLRNAWSEAFEKLKQKLEG